MKAIPLSQIGYEPKYYPRVNGKEDWYTVNIYKDALLADPKKADSTQPKHSPFPPIVVTAVTGQDYKYLLLDGLHRLKAFVAAGQDKIYATIERLPESKWFARATELNASSKRGLDTGDKAWAAKRLEHEGYSIEQVANILQMRVDSLKKIVVQRAVKLTNKKNIPPSRSRRTVNGQSFGFLKAPFANVANTKSAKKALQVQAPITSRDGHQIVDSLIAFLKSNSLDFNNHVLVEKLQELTELLNQIKLPVA